MRKLALLASPREDVRSCVLYATDKGTYVFPRRTAEDGPSSGDYWFVDVAEAEEFCRDEYGIGTEDWTTVPDPAPGCRHDWIRAVPIG